MSLGLWLVGVYLCSFSAGTLGALVGIGGGIIVIPSLTVLFGVDIRHAVAASLIAVIASSSAASIGNLKRDMANVKLAMLLETGTVTGAIGGALLSAYVSKSFLYAVFALLLAYVLFSLLRKATSKTSIDEEVYEVRNKPLGIVLSSGAGLLSGLLGVGGGVVKVPMMNLVMGVPIRVAAATSNLMIGVTAAASAIVYFMRGDTIPLIVLPVALGTISGARMGAKCLHRIPSEKIRKLFIGVLIILLLQMLYRGARS